MGIISTIPEKCGRCYTCVRECPAKAIKVEQGQATVIEDRCIACGNCIKVCAKKAKKIEDSTAEVMRMLEGGDRVFACLAPSFPAAFAEQSPGQIVSALRTLGFEQVWMVAFGAELISREYTKLFKETKESRKFMIASPCPAIVSFVEQYIPTLLDSLAPIVSPMIATARAIRKRHGRDVRVVFIGPCTAKKAEIREPSVAGAVDSALTFSELVEMFDKADIKPGVLPKSDLDGPGAFSGSAFPIPGGLIRTACLGADILENDIISTEGKDRVLSMLHTLANAPGQALLLDALLCEGCISGPIMRNDLSFFARKQIIINFISELNSNADRLDTGNGLEEFKDLDLSRSFTPRNILLPEPGEEDINRVLLSMKKYTIGDQLNCGACGYQTCREKAIAVCQGLAEAAMCLPYLVDELELTCEELKKANEDLASAQERLVLTERLASLGQLSAGVAHEINNPLGTILLFSHALLKQIEEGDSRQKNLQTIVSEATRCKNIVRGLLDFARQSRVSKAPTNLTDLIKDVVLILKTAAELAHVRLWYEFQADLPLMMIDSTQVKQMLVNLAQNGIDSISGSGEVKISARLIEGDNSVEITVTDNGSGIPRENLSKVFTPFFTTKKMGEGTGLGLAIAYGVVKMHSGDISVQSEEGKGTTVLIKLPVGQEEDINNMGLLPTLSEPEEKPQ
ncbi:MAG: 4Fe-4S binding protein [Candidatus Hydrogenedentota bacterium]|nr:MAG: 4Fe-4S binding protein [Candidatus Hydrogenedentota bacterium]